MSKEEKNTPKKPTGNKKGNESKIKTDNKKSQKKQPNKKVELPKIDETKKQKSKEAKKTNKQQEKKVEKIKETTKVEEPKKVEVVKTEETKVEDVKVEETKVEPEEKVQPIIEENHLDKPIELPTIDSISEQPEILNNVSYQDKINKYFKPAAIVGGILLVIIAIISTLSSPKNIIKSQIKASFELTEEALDFYEENSEKAFNTSATFTIDTSDDESLKNYKFTYQGNIYPKENIYNFGATINKGKENIDGNIYYQESGTYLTSSLLENPIDISNYMDLELDEFTEIYNEYSKYYDEYDIILNTIEKEILKNIDSSQIEKDSVKRTIGSKTVRLKEYSYELDEDYLSDTIKEICEDLLENDEFISALSKITDEDKSDIKDIIKEIKSEAKDIELEEDINIKFYTKGLLNKPVGYVIEYDDKEYVSAFYYKQNLEIIIDEDLYGADFVIYGEPEDDNMVVTVKVDKEKIASFTVRELSDEKIDLDYTIYDGNDKYKGTILFTGELLKNKYNGEYKFTYNYDDEYLKVDGTYSYEIKDSIEKLSIKSAVDYEEVDYSELKSKIKEKITDEELYEIIYSYVDEIESDALDLNYVGMRKTTYEEAKDLLTNNKPTVLYIGDDYYSYSKTESKEFLQNVQDLQTELNFRSYYLDSYDAEYGYEDETDCSNDYYYYYDDSEVDCYYEDFYDLLPALGAEDCISEDMTSCNKTYDRYKPYLVLINNGEIVKVLTNENTKEEISAALQEIGIGIEKNNL